jgi:hypothetical protein
LSPWRERILELARRDNVYCKIYGLVTEASWTERKPEDRTVLRYCARGIRCQTSDVRIPLAGAVGREFIYVVS